MTTNQGSRAVLDGLLAKTHVQHALVQSDGRHNELPSALATLFLLDGTPEDLQRTYDSLEGNLRPWEPSPRGISNEESKSRFLGDPRFQRAFMTYFSMENGRFAGNTKSLAISHLFTGDSPLIHGLFAGIGQPLTLLADGIELRAAILVMESLTLSAVGWMAPVGELLTHPELAAPSAAEHLSPEDVIGRAAYDGRLSGVMKAGPGFHGVAHVLSSPGARAAVVECLRCLDTRDVPALLQQLSALSVLLLAATHKPNRPAFDLYLARLPTCVNSVRVMLERWVEDETHRRLLVRGLWLVVVLTYVTQLRPVIDGKLLVSRELAEETGGWDAIMDRIRGQGMEGREGGHDFLRAVRSLRELSREYGAAHGRLYVHAAWKLLRSWQGWTGLGKDREATLNIRL